MAATLTRERLIGAAPETTKITLTTGDLAGEVVVIRSLSKGARQAWAEAIAAGDSDASDILLIESMVEPKLSPADVQALNSVDVRVVEEIIAAIIEFNGWGAKPEEARVELLKKVADGEVSPEEAARTFPGA